MGKLKERVEDGFANLLKGLGTLAGSSSTSYHVDSLTSTGYAELFENDWLAQRVVRIFPDDALRKRPSIKDTDEAEAKKIWAEYDRLDTRLQFPAGALAHGLYQGRALGGSAILLGFERGRTDLPAPPIGATSKLRWIDVVPWEDLTVETREPDRNKAGYGWPLTYRIGGKHERRGEVFHISRLIPCEALPRTAPDRSDETPWISVLQPIWEVIHDYNMSWESVSLLLQEASVGVLKMEGLTRMLTSEDQVEIKARQALMAEGRSAAKTVFLDAEFNEEFSRTEVSFAGVPDTLEQLQMRVSGAARVPATRLFGRSPSGQNSTGESDLKIFQDDVKAYQNQAVKPKQTLLLSLIAGREVELEYPPLAEMSETERAQIGKMQSESDQTYYDLGVLDPEDIAISRSSDGSLGVEIQNIEVKFPDGGQTPEA